jgi:hypothetical protein
MRRPCIQGRLLRLPTYCDCIANVEVQAELLPGIWRVITQTIIYIKLTSKA